MSSVATQRHARTSNRPDRCQRWLAVAVVLASLAFASCGKKSGAVAQEQVNLSWLGSMYGMYISQNQGHAPKTIDEFHKFVEKNTTPDKLARLNVGSVNDLFVSPRDGKPFALVSYEKLPGPTGLNGNPPVLYEIDGKNNEHAVALLGGGTKTVSDSELQSLLPPTKRVH